MPMDITTLGIAVDSRQVKQADKDLNQLGQTAGKTEKQTKGLTDATSKLTTALTAVATALSVRSIIEVADSYKLMEGRLRLVTTSAQNLVTVQKELFAIAQESRVSLEATVDLYSRLARSTKTLGVNQKDLLSVTETINKSFIISGASAESANAAIIQLGQAFASGTLRGDELNSVMEQSPRLAEAIAAGMGKTVGQLRALGAEGKITAEAVFNALKSQGDAIDTEFGKMPKTVGQAMTQIQNSFVDLVGSADKAINGTGGLASIMSSLAVSISDNKREIIEFGGDFLKAMQMMGAGVVGVASGALSVIDGLAGGLMKALQNSLNMLIMFINASLSAAETATNRVRGLFGGDRVNLGRISAFTFGDEMLAQSAKRFSESANAFKTVGALYKEIGRDTVVLSKGAEKLETATAGAAKSMGELTKEQKKAIEQEAELQRKFDHDILQGRLTAISERTLKAQEAIEKEAEEQIKWDHDIAQGRLSAITERTLKAQEEREKEAEASKQFWDDIFNNVSKAMDAQFFDAMTGKFQSFGDWLKDFWGSISDSLLRGVSRSLADVVVGGARGGVQNLFSTFGGLFGAGGVTTAASAADIATGGVAAAGGGGWLDSIGIASNLSTLKDLAMGGLMAPSAYVGQLAGMAYGAGLTGTGSFLGGVANAFAGGSASGLSGGAFAGNVLGAGAMGALGGYAVGSLGDRLFGADTRAANYGAIGGGLGAAIGSVVPGLGTIVGGALGTALGSIVGGMFGKTKQTGSGLMAWQNITADTTEALGTFTDFTKKSWFKSRSWTEFGGLDADTKKQIKGLFETYDYLLGQLGDVDRIVVGAGRYTGTSFFNAIDKAFIRAFVDNPALTETLYNSWLAFAGKVGQTAQQAFAETIGGFVQYKRGFEIFGLDRLGNSMEALRRQAEWARGDFEALEAMMGVSGVTLENFTSMYDAAVKANFTPETFKAWQTLGDALKAATTANDQYVESLKQSEMAGMQMRDALLARTTDATTFFAGIDRSTEESRRLFVDMVDYLRRIYQDQVLGTTLQGTTI